MPPRSGAKPPIPKPGIKSPVRKTKKDRPSRDHGVLPLDILATSSLLQTVRRASDHPSPQGETENQPPSVVKIAVDKLLTELGISAESLRGISGITPEDKEQNYFEIFNALAPDQRADAFSRAANLVGPNGLDALDAEFRRRTHELIHPEFSGNAVPTSPKVEHPETETYGPTMVEDDRIITKQGTRYFPIPLAANLAQSPRSTLVNWIRAKVEVQGRPLQIYNSPTARKTYLAEESVQRLANRFIRWPSAKPAGPVTIGKTQNLSGYIGISKAARVLGVDPHTMWLWTAQGKAPTDKPLDVIKCAVTDLLYVSEKDVNSLKSFIPKSGLSPGRRARIPSASAPRSAPR